MRYLVQSINNFIRRNQRDGGCKNEQKSVKIVFRFLGSLYGVVASAIRSVGLSYNPRAI